MLSRQEARSVLQQYAETWITGHQLGLGHAGRPLIFLGDDDGPFTHVATLKDPDDGRSAYHIAKALHEPVQALEATSLTVCMFAYKVIQGIKYHGWMLYHVDTDGHRHTRILDPERGHQWILDGSRYWKAFPYDFSAGPEAMPAILGRHDEVVDNPDAAGFDELLRP